MKCSGCGVYHSFFLCERNCSKNLGVWENEGEDWKSDHWVSRVDSVSVKGKCGSCGGTGKVTVSKKCSHGKSSSHEYCSHNSTTQH